MKNINVKLNIFVQMQKNIQLIEKNVYFMFDPFPDEKLKKY